MASTLSTFDAFIKDYFDEEEVVRITCKERLFLAKLLAGGKKLGAGDPWIVPAVISNPQGVGATLAKAQAGAAQGGGGGNLKGIKWSISWGDYSGAIEIGDKVMKASKSNVGAFFENSKAEIEGLYDTFANTMAAYAIGDQGHSLTPGTFTIASGGVCQLALPDDIVNIELGQILVASANDGTSSSHTLLGSGAAGYVISKNSNAGTFTVSASAGGSGGIPSGWTGAMHAFRDGDFGGSGATRIMLGVSAWCPLADPSSTLHEGVDRTIAMTALSGVRLTATEIAGLNIENRLKMLVTRMVGRAMGPGPTDIVCNPEKWQALADILEARGQRPLDSQVGKFGFKSLQLTAGGKSVEVWADRFCNVGRAFALNMDYVEMRTLDGFPSVINEDGLKMLRKANANDYEMRLQAYPALVSRAPGYSGVVPV